MKRFIIQHIRLLSQLNASESLVARS